MVNSLRAEDQTPSLPESLVRAWKPSLSFLYTSYKEVDLCIRGLVVRKTGILKYQELLPLTEIHGNKKRPCCTAALSSLPGLEQRAEWPAQ